jgi:hypothetical protein
LLEFLDSPPASTIAPEASTASKRPKRAASAKAVAYDGLRDTLEAV